LRGKRPRFLFPGVALDATRTRDAAAACREKDPCTTQAKNKRGAHNDFGYKTSEDTRSPKEFRNLGAPGSATQPSRRGRRNSVASALASGGFAELRELEAKNQKLRKVLGDRLRGENADLGKKLRMA